jgi:hypothetical protein
MIFPTEIFIIVSIQEMKTITYNFSLFFSDPGDTQT